MAGDAERWGRAKERGLALLDRVERIDAGHFRVPSQRVGQPAYTVTLIGHPGSLHCECPAALADQPCAHVAAVVWWIKRHNQAIRERRAREGRPVRRCQQCFLSGATLLEAPGGRLLCGQCAQDAQREHAVARRYGPAGQFRRPARVA
jgi:hypothetical protein